MKECICTQCNKDLTAEIGVQNIPRQPARFKVVHTPFSSAHVHPNGFKKDEYFCSGVCIATFYSK